MTKEQLAELERINELKARIWAHAANKVIKGESDPLEIEEENIESNKGRIDKALRLLHGSVEYKRAIKSQYRRDLKIYEILNFDESKNLTELPVFVNDIKDLHNSVTSYYGDEQTDFDTISYRSLTDLADKQILYIYWHQNEYSLIKHEKAVYVFPNALLEERNKLILRSIIEQYLHTNFHTWLENKLSISENSLKYDDHFNLQIRNFAAHGYRFSMYALFGQNGFLDEYTHFKDYFETLVKNLNDFNQVIQKAGGFDVLLKSFRDEIFCILLKQAPVYAFRDAPERNYSQDSIEILFKHPHMYKFLITHSNLFNYDTLYGTDTSILKIGESNSCLKDGADTFIPDPTELKVIEDHKKKDAQYVLN
jgi:hypothetical protein